MYICLDKMSFYAHHGVAPQETLVGNIFTIDLKLKTDFSRATETDELEYTVSYADIYKAVKKRCRSRPNYWNTFAEESFAGCSGIFQPSKP